MLPILMHSILLSQRYQYLNQQPTPPLSNEGTFLQYQRTTTPTNEIYQAFEETTELPITAVDLIIDYARSNNFRTVLRQLHRRIDPIHYDVWGSFPTTFVWTINGRNMYNNAYNNLYTAYKQKYNELIFQLTNSNYINPAIDNDDPCYIRIPSNDLNIHLNGIELIIPVYYVDTNGLQVYVRKYLIKHHLAAFIQIHMRPNIFHSRRYEGWISQVHGMELRQRIIFRTNSNVVYIIKSSSLQSLWLSSDKWKQFINKY